MKLNIHFLRFVELNRGNIIELVILCWKYVKASTLTPCLTDEAVQFIVCDFASHPRRAKSRNITIFLDDSDEEEHDNDDD